MKKANLSLNNIVLLSDSSKWLLFHNPLKIYSTYNVNKIISTLEEIEEQTKRENLFAAGFISYEAAPAFDNAFKVKKSQNFPLLWFGLYPKPKTLFMGIDINNIIPQTKQRSEYFSKFTPEISKKEYNFAFKKIKNLIEKGDCYQVNFSFGLKNQSKPNAPGLFRMMHAHQPGKFSSYIKTNTFSICSISPELFFSLNQNRLVSVPMKGTSRRGLWYEQDISFMKYLKTSPKEKSENVMIVDMVRNDMGKIAQDGSVKVVSLFDVERYPTLLQMTSTIECTTDKNISQIFSALFPGASITGAPKIRASEIIYDIEKSPRKIYTGAIGFIAPERKARFSIAIRTLLIDEKHKTTEYRIGSGIVWNSDVQKEWDECHTKANILKKNTKNFSLIETLLWQPDTHFYLLEEHLQRLKNSAEYFLFSIDPDQIKKKITDYGKSLTLTHSNHINVSDKQDHKVRVLVSNNGEVHIESYKLKKNPEKYFAGIAEKPVDNSDIFLYHKTTNRDAYERALINFKKGHDLLFYNHKGELTESSTANIVCKIDGVLFTPPVECGLLSGVYRNFLLQKKQVKEKKIHIKELRQASRIYLINSVRKMWEIVLMDQ